MSRNPALETKVKAMKSQLLSDHDYNELIEAESVDEIVTYLKEKTPYGTYLQDLKSLNISRTDVEGVLNNRVIEQARKILFFLNGNEREFIRLIIKRITLSSLLILVRSLARKEDIGSITARLALSKRYKSKKAQELIKAGNWDSFKEALRNSIYYRSLETYNTLTPQNVFQIEKTLERSYYDLLFKKLRKLDKNENQKLIKVLRTEIDLLNLIWIYRAKKFYSFSSDQILSYIYIGGLKIRDEELQTLSQTSNYEDLIYDLKKYDQYEFLFDHANDSLDLHMDRRKKRYMYFQFKNLLFFGNAVTSAYAYLRLLEDEIIDIISIMEAKHYHLTREETLEYLIHPIS